MLAIIKETLEIEQDQTEDCVEILLCRKTLILCTCRIYLCGEVMGETLVSPDELGGACRLWSGWRRHQGNLQGRPALHGVGR